MRQGKIIFREMQKVNSIYHASLVFSIELERNKYTNLQRYEII